MTRCMALSVAILTSFTASGQLHIPFSANHYERTLGEEQYRQSFYRLSRQSHQKYLATQDKLLHTPVELSDRARYYSRLLELKLKVPHAVDSGELYIDQAANPVYRQRMSYALGQYYFHAGQWVQAIPYYENASIANLSNTEIADSKFELAYCYFNNRQFDEADVLFASMKEISGKYYVPGNYYYGLLAYNKSDYDNALKSFERIQEFPQYRNIVPYYIAELHYFKGDRQKALNLSQELLKRPEKLYYDNELYLLAAQCLFEDKKYSEALPYFEHYYNNQDRIRKEEVYKMGYCYYQVKNWTNAIEKFKDLSGSQDSLGQTAMYLLGDCYLETGDKKGARNAFSICAEMPYNAAQQEAALLLSGKLAYEAGYNSEGTMRIRQLLELFPQSVYRNEARTLLSEQLLRSDNYAAAFEMLQEVNEQDDLFRRVWQKAAYGYALQQLQNHKTIEADQLLNRSLEYPESSEYAAAAWFWKGEIAYRDKRYDEAIEHTRRFLEKNLNKPMVTRVSAAATQQHALLNIGYAYMGLHDYERARSYFNQAQQAQTSEGYSAQSAADAQLREADAAFMQKDYGRALSLYSKTINSGIADVDYARFQKAVIAGLQGKYPEKESLLKSILEKVPASEYADDAYYELGETYLDQNKYQPAIDAFGHLTENDYSRHYAPRAFMKIAYCYQEMGNDDKAIEAYKNVVALYPASELRLPALDALKSLYVSNNRPGEYVQLLKENNLDTTNTTAADSIFYAAAEAQYASAKYAAAITAMSNYLQQYPNGIFAIKAHFYKAESHYQDKEYDAAFKEYDIVTKSGWNDFTETSVKRAATLAYAKGDNVAAEVYYRQLQANTSDRGNLEIAYRGLMLTAFNQARDDSAVVYADSLLTLTGKEKNAAYEALLIKGKIALRHSDYEAANIYFNQVTTAGNSDIAAEALYYVAHTFAQQNKIKEAEAAANKAIQQSSANAWWNTKSYLVMADVFTKQKDYFNAKATLQSLIKNVKNEELKNEAVKKLEQVKALEKSGSKLSEE